MIRILHVVFQMNRGGMESRIMDIYRSINREEISFDFLEHTSELCEYDKEIVSLGGKIYKDRYSLKKVLETICYLRHFFKNKGKDYDYIHVHESYLPNINYVVMFFAKKYMTNCKFIVHSRSSSGSRRVLHNLVKRDYCQQFDYYISCSRKAAYWMFPQNIVKTDKYMIWNNAIDAAKFRFNNVVRNSKREQLGIKEKFVLGHVGGFKYVKNHDFLLQVFKRITEEYEDSILLLIGDGELKEEIEKKVKKNKLENKVIFTGVISNVSEYYQVMDVFLLPSFYEGLPGVGVEAQAAGLPCIFSDRITKEVSIISDRVFFESIDHGISAWISKLKLIRKESYSRDTFQEIQDQGFDCRQEIRKIEEFYLNSR